MRIGIGALATSARPGVRQSGIHWYARRLVQHLSGVPGEDELVVYATDPGFRSLAERRVTVRVPRLSLDHPASRVIWEQLLLPRQINHDHLNLYHGLAFSLPRRGVTPSVVTIHDLAFLRWPDQVPTRRSAWLSRAVHHAARHANRIIVPSDHTRNEVIDLLGVSPDRIDVTPLGVDPTMRRPSDDELRAFRLSRHLDRPFILAVGNLEPRKNLPALIDAFSLLLDDVPHMLVLAGAEGWRSGALQQALDNPKLAGRVLLTGFVPREELRLWYGACECFVISSLDEGFGLTLLEAMACGAPAIASNRGALPEVGGDAVLLTEPEPQSIAAALPELLNHSELRRDLSQMAIERAGSFTWQRTAELTMDCYRKALT